MVIIKNLKSAPYIYQYIYMDWLKEEDVSVINKEVGGQSWEVLIIDDDE